MVYYMCTSVCVCVCVVYHNVCYFNASNESRLKNKSIGVGVGVATIVLIMAVIGTYCYMKKMYCIFSFSFPRNLELT